MYFNSRPHGGRPLFPCPVIRFYFISTHALTEGDSGRDFTDHHADISTHALTEGDETSHSRTGTQKDFNSRPHGGRPKTRRRRSLRQRFQLTPSRRATFCCSRSVCASCNFNSRPHGGRHDIPRLESVPSLFQLTPSRRATTTSKTNQCVLIISTHALTEGDGLEERNVLFRLYFNSRPHGGRRS